MTSKLLFTFYSLFTFYLSFSQKLVIDTNFGINGVVQTSFGSDDNNLATLALQFDGKIIACGSLYKETLNPFSITNQLVLSRYNVDGSLDMSFGTYGKVIMPIGTFGENEKNSVRVLKDGKILVKANNTTKIEPFKTISDYVLIRFNDDGSLDSEFGDNGILYSNVNNEFGYASVMDVQPDSKIVIGGSNNSLLTTNNYPNFAISRHLENGLIDNSFGVNGFVSINFGTISNPGFYTEDVISCIKVQPDGKILAAGYTSYGQERSKFALLRLDEDGTLDTAFGSNGKVITDFNLDDDSISSLELLPDGKIIAIGIYYYNDDANEKIIIAKYNADGSLDTTYGISGKVTVDNGYSSPQLFAFSSQLLNDGKLLIVGSTNNPNYDGFMLRLNTDGTQDTTLSSNGFLYTDFIGGEMVADVLLLSDGKIVLGGLTQIDGQNQFTLWRYKNETLSTNDFFANDILNVYPNPFNDFLNIDLYNYLNKNVSIELYDVSGKTILNKLKFDSSNHSIRLQIPQDIPKGVYFLKLTNESNISVVKLVK